MTGALYDLIYLLPLAVSVTSLCALYDDPRIVTAVTAAFVIYVLLIWHLKLRERILLIGLGITVLCAFIFYHPAGERLDFILASVWIFKTASIVLSCMLMHKLCTRYRLLRIITAAAGCAMIIAMFIYTSNNVNRIFVLAVFFHAIFTLADVLQSFSEKEGDTEPKKHLVFCAPFILLMFVVLTFIKVPEEPYGWKLVKRIYSAMQSEYAKISDRLSGTGWDSDNPVIGFSDSGSFGGNLNKQGYKVMDLQLTSQCGTYMYLKGGTFDSFDGTGWTLLTEETETAPGFDTIETIAGLKAASQDVQMSDLCRRISLKAKNTRLRTSRIFVPAKTIPPIVAERKSYGVSYYILNRNAEATGDILKNAKPTGPDSYASALDECGITDRSLYSYDNFLKYREEVYSTYLPETVISDRARQYMDEILEGADSDYEKLLRIEEMLGSCRYNSSPGLLPDTLESPADYVDYFLFEKKEGYCSYFATAFVILSRSYGIPSRYVQGYHVNAKNFSNIEVYSNNAHAWPESYIDGIGWIAFEPTPGFYTTNIYGWRIHSEGEEKASDSSVNPYLDEHEEEPDEEELAEETEESHIEWYRIAIPIAAGVLFTVLLFLIDWLIKKRRYQKLDDRGKALWQCRRCLQLLSRRGLGMLPGETLAEYEVRLKDLLPGREFAFCKIYERLLYSDKGISAEERIATEEEAEQLKKR